MLDVPSPSKSPAATEAATAKNVNGQADSAKQKRALRKLLRDLISFTGVAIHDIAATPRKAPQQKRRRLLYCRADTLADTDLDVLVAEVGPARLMAALDRWTQPSMFSVAASEGRLS